MIRLFVALEMTRSAAEALAALCEGLPGARWSLDDAFHLTLRFIGEVDHATFDDVLFALGEIEADAFELALAGVGHFPPRGPPRVVWAGVRANPVLAALQARVEGAVVRAGLPPEARNYSPHITLARLRAPPLERVQAYLARHALFAVEPFAVEAFHLYSSRMTSEGSQYRIEASYPLRGAYDFSEAWTEADEAAHERRRRG
jgi:2'-5' RNA ligase